MIRQRFLTIDQMPLVSRSGLDRVHSSDLEDEVRYRKVCSSSTREPWDKGGAMATSPTRSS